MRIIPFVFFLMFGVMLGAAVDTPADSKSLAIVNAEAWTLDGPEPVRDATILIDNGRVVSVQAGGLVPAGARTLDAAGRPVTPGLVNGATQIGLVDLDLRDDRSTGGSGASFDPSLALNGHSALVSLARADGLTRALVYPSPARTGPISGAVSVVRLREGSDILDRARIALHAVIGDLGSDRSASRAEQWEELRRKLVEARRGEPLREVERARRREAGRPPAFEGGEAKYDLLKEVAAGTLPLAIETHRESDIRQAVALASELGIRLILVGASEAWRVAHLLAAADIPVIIDPLANLPSNFDELGTREDNAARLVEAGVRIAFGQTGGRSIPANYNAGLSLREGAGIAVANGLAYVEALRAMTAGPLAIWGRGGGTLTPGGEADLVIWDGDPLEPSTNAVAIIVEGRQLSSRSRQDLLAERYKGK